MENEKENEKEKEEKKKEDMYILEFFLDFSKWNERITFVYWVLYHV